MSIRRARANEAAALTALAIRSKAWWGYDPAFMARAEAELTFQPARFEPDFLVFALEDNGRIAGFYSLIPLTPETIEMNDFFVDPDHIGRGAGRRLWLHAVQIARSLNYQSILLTADPHAEAFYRKCGATTIGFIPSGVQEGRSLPRMEYELYRPSNCPQ